MEPINLNLNKTMTPIKPIIVSKQMTATKPNLVPKPEQMPITKPVVAKPGIAQPTEPIEPNKSIIPTPISIPASLTNK